jgi:hypothetical protein
VVAGAGRGFEVVSPGRASAGDAHAPAPGCRARNPPRSGEHGQRSVLDATAAPGRKEGEGLRSRVSVRHEPVHDRAAEARS